jgi:hypothetical protein
MQRGFLMSFPRKRDARGNSRTRGQVWIPAYAGMTPCNPPNFSWLRPSTTLLRVPTISLQINFRKGGELIRRDSVTAVQQRAALQQREKFHG